MQEGGGGIHIQKSLNSKGLELTLATPGTECLYSIHVFFGALTVTVLGSHFPSVVRLESSSVTFEG